MKLDMVPWHHTAVEIIWISEIMSTTLTMWNVVNERVTLISLTLKWIQFHLSDKSAGKRSHKPRSCFLSSRKLKENFCLVEVWFPVLHGPWRALGLCWVKSNFNPQNNSLTDNVKLVWSGRVPARSVWQPSGFSMRTYIKEAAECVLSRFFRCFGAGHPGGIHQRRPVMKNETHLGHSRLSDASAQVLEKNHFFKETSRLTTTALFCLEPP